MPLPEIIPEQAIAGPAADFMARGAQDLRVADALASRDSARWMQAEDVRKLRILSVHAPELPDAAVHDVYGRVLEAEATIAGARRLADYAEGVATHDDELLVATFPGSVLLEAQHATDPVRKDSGVREGADHGTGGLGLVLAEDLGGRIIVPVGRQSGNANVDPDHPIKEQLLDAAASGKYDRFFAVHGCYPGKVVHPMDVTEVHGVIGLGKNPGEADYERALQIVRRARDELGLRILVGNVTPHLNCKKDPNWDGTSFRDRTGELATNKQGQVAAPRLASTMPASTVTFMRERTGMPASQVELSRSLRLMPIDTYRRPDPSAEAYGVYLGYQLCRLAIAG
jgi:hypothetical protein